MRKYILLLLIFISYFGLSQTSPTYENITIRNQATIRQKVYFIPTISAPAVPFEGMLYADTDHHLYYYNGTSWLAVSSVEDLNDLGDVTLVAPDGWDILRLDDNSNQWINVSFPDFINEIDSTNAASPTAYSQWVRDSVALTTTIAHSTDTVIIGNTLMFAANKTAIIKTSKGYFMGGAYSAGTGSANIGIGPDALKLWTGFGGSNIGIGYQSLYGADSTSSLIAIGGFAAYGANALGNSIAMGISAGQGARGTGNCFIGYNVGGVNLSSDYVTGDYLFGVGYEALAGTDASHVNAFGYDAGWNSDGSYGNYMGKEAGADNDGNYTNFFGVNAGAANLGNHVTGLGFWACQGNSANYVIGIGYEAAKSNTDSAVYILKYNNLNATALHKGYFISGLNVFPKVQVDTLLTVSDSLYVEGNAEFNADVYVTSAVKMQGATLTFSGGGGMASDLDMNAYNIDDADSVNTGSISFTDPTVWMDSFRKNAFYFDEFMNVNVANHDPWLGAAVTSGALSTGTSVANHPGVAMVVPSGTANSGYRVSTIATSQIIAGGEMFEIVFQALDTTNLLLRAGFIDVVTTSDQTDGIYIEINSNTTVRGKTSAATTRSTTSTGYVITQDTWYRAKIVVNSDATRVDFTLYSDAGAVLWTNNLTTNIPTDPTGCGFVALETDAVGNNLINFDYMSMYLGTLIR